MPAITLDQTLHLIHSKLYSASPSSWPADEPLMYWSVQTPDQTLKVTTFGYKNPIKEIKKHIPNTITTQLVIKEYL